MVGQNIFSPPLLFSCWIRDPRSGMKENQFSPLFTAARICTALRFNPRIRNQSIYVGLDFLFRRVCPDPSFVI
jgi:hypothetical protein